MKVYVLAKHSSGRDAVIDVFDSLDKAIAATDIPAEKWYADIANDWFHYQFPWSIYVKTVL